MTISSSSAQSDAPQRAHYVASKGGVIALTKAPAYEPAPQGITVNTIPASIVDTPMAQAGVEAETVPSLDILATMVPVRRNGTLDDIAATAAFLCSDGASYITGQVIGVNAACTSGRPSSSRFNVLVKELRPGALLSAMFGASQTWESAVELEKLQ